MASRASACCAAALMGHGIGRRIHEAPNVPNHFDARLTQPLGEGLVIAIEPLVRGGARRADRRAVG